MAQPSILGTDQRRLVQLARALATIVIMLVMLGVYQAGRMIVRLLWRWTMRGTSVANGGAANVEFYRRLESLLAGASWCAASARHSANSHWR